MLNIVCVNSGSKYSNEYVNILCDSIVRNIDSKTAFKFICFTNNAEGLDIDIETRPLPSELEGRGWWNKLYLFKDGLFPDGDRIVFFDLKNVIISSLDEVIAYNGDFAILRDFYRVDGAQSGLMAWKANKLGYIWDSYQKRMPELKGGDQEWIEMCYPRPDFWQDMFPDAFKSYKAHDCHAGIPKGAKIVFFHGKPWPEDIKDGWVPHVWKVGGGTSLEFMVECNTNRSEIIDNIKYSLATKKPLFDKLLPENNGHAVIVGGGPSINNFVDEIKMRQVEGQQIVALNNSWEWLDKHDIPVNYHVMLDARIENENFIPKSEVVQKLYATQCHPNVTRIADTLWNALILDIVPIFDKTNDMFWIGSGTTVGVRSIFLMYALGYREFHIYGFDSCYEGENGHAYEQTLNTGERIIDVEVCGRKFKAAPWMVTQMHDFLETVEHLTSQGCMFTIHGDGMLQHAAANGLNAVNIEVTQYKDIVKINGTFWPEYDRICYPSMINTVDDVYLYLKETKNKRIAVQAGGNVGMFPKRLAHSFDHVYTFEPDALNFQCLKLNCTENNITCENAALGDVDGFISIKKVDDNCGANFVDGEGDIPVKTIDGLNLDFCDLIQLDIEGYEMKALHGAVKTIEKFHPVIVIEENGLSVRYGVENGDVGEWLKKFGYEPANSIHRDLIFKHKSGE